MYRFKNSIDNVGYFRSSSKWYRQARPKPGEVSRVWPPPPNSYKMCRIYIYFSAFRCTPPPDNFSCCISPHQIFLATALQTSICGSENFNMFKIDKNSLSTYWKILVWQALYNLCWANSNKSIHHKYTTYCPSNSSRKWIALIGPCLDWSTVT